jgi:hypothetical protein
MASPSLPLCAFDRDLHLSPSLPHPFFSLLSSSLSLDFHSHAQDREAVEVANLEERKLVLKFEADELDRTRDELVRSLEEKRKSQV